MADYVSLTTQRTLAIPVPPIGAQRAVAVVVRALDGKIDVNRRMSKTLEETARALFRSWFVDFGPVHAKATARQPFGMDAATAALFPDGFEDTILGAVPRGWQVGPLDRLLVLKRGYDLPTAARQLGPFPIVSSGGPSGAHAEWKVRGPGVVTGRYGTIGKVFWVPEDFWPLNTTLYVVDFKGTPPAYAYHALAGLDFDKFSDKAAVPGVNRNHVHLEPVLVPPRGLMAAFADIAATLRSRAIAAANESASLARLRDYLLPKLLSGDVRVRDAEKLVSDVA